VRFTWPLGRWLLARRGFLWSSIRAAQSTASPAAISAAPNFTVPNKPDIGDIAYSERVMFRLNQLQDRHEIWANFKLSRG
jgi:hypothetical protein